MRRALVSSVLRAGPRSRWSASSTVSHLRDLHGSTRCQQSVPAPAAVEDPTKPATDTIFSGIQPTGIPHLGNYLGALKKWVSLQDESPKDTKLIFCLVDLHALTVPQLPAQLLQWKRESLATLLAIGLDPERCTIFEQSSVPAHVELMWLLSCNASMGLLNRMTQWKAKTRTSDEDGTSEPAVKLGLFSYPVLQAADIMIHRPYQSATHVPVGEDQIQHLELTRNLVTSFNHVFGPTFPLPTVLLSPAKRIMSLREPQFKMSKSAPDSKTRILLTDTPATIKGKIKAAMTDSYKGIEYDPSSRPGTSNLIEIYAHMTGRDDFDKIAEEFEAAGTGKQGLKDKVSDAVIEGLEVVRKEYGRIIGEVGYLKVVAKIGEEKAQESAARTLQRVKRAVGLI